MASPPMSKPRSTAQFLSPVDLTVEVGEKDGKRTIAWTPAFRFIDTATVAPDPETQSHGR